MTAMRRHAGGFTLLEVLVAMSLVGVLTVLVYTGMHIGIRSWDAVQTRSQAAVVERTTRNWLRRQIGGLVPVRWDEAKQRRIAFAGDKSGFRFFGSWTHPTRGGGLYMVALGDEEIDGARALVLAYQARDTERTELAGVGEVEERRLGHRFAALRFEYFGAPGKQDVRRWRQNWPRQASRYPELVRISGERSDQRAWPQLVVALPGASLEDPL